ncbi:MAG: galactokinase [Oscillospiraceae bacterium]|nr:galactokinase [Oscillospiraceae bacterium]
MSDCSQLLAALKSGAHDKALAALYALDGSAQRLDEARARAVGTVEAFAARFGADAPNAALFSGPGRTEIGGNHTDHQHGRVLCGSVDLDMLACAAPNGTRLVRIQSEGYPALEIDLDDLAPKKGEENTSAALVRGVAAKIRELGYELSGFDACANSTVLSGSGLSSSAAYEVLVGNMFNHFCCDDKLDPVTIAKIGQYAENVYFGKPCGLMDQMGSSVGGAVFIDFNDPADPVVEKVDFDPAAAGYALCIIDSGADHADLTEEYAAVPMELKEICAHFGKNVLREVSGTELFAALPELRKECGDRAVLRAMHVYHENYRVDNQVAALKRGDFDFFLSEVRESGLSSWRLLQNIVPAGYTRHQEMAFALALAECALDTAGAVRVHGGGFAGTIQAFVPTDKLDTFKTGMEALLGAGKCHILHIRPVGGCVVAE